MSEPGFWTMAEEEMEGLRAYLLKGGFVIFDDFRENHMYNPRRRCAACCPRRRGSGSTRRIRFFILFRNQSARGCARVLRHPWNGTDLRRQRPEKTLDGDCQLQPRSRGAVGIFDTGYFPVDLSNEAYKFGVNYVVYAMTH